MFLAPIVRVIGTLRLGGLGALGLGGLGALGLGWLALHPTASKHTRATGPDSTHHRFHLDEA